MPRIDPFELHSERYEEWFQRHPAAYASELAAVRELWPSGVDGLEVGVGAGHFAAPLGIAPGVEPSSSMRRRARQRGVCAVGAVAEHLPFPDARFSAVLIVTTLCFVDDPQQSLREVRRVLRSAGSVVIGFVDRESRLGREYEQARDRSVFYRDARFFSCSELARLLADRFAYPEYRQTLFSHPDTMQVPDPVRVGLGEEPSSSCAPTRSRRLFLCTAPHRRARRHVA